MTALQDNNMKIPEDEEAANAGRRVLGSDMLKVWTDHTTSVPERVDYQLNGVNHSSEVKLSTQQRNVTDVYDATGTCDVYDGIMVDDVSTEPYTVKCCGTPDTLCDVFAQVTSGNRKLCGGCFSPMSTVVEKTKGKMLLKDLKLGDSILAANQVFQPYLFDIHSHPSKPTEYLQIHTEDSETDPETSPIELTSGHMIFVEGKDLPVFAGDVELNDSLVGTIGPTKVTKITKVMRDGLYNGLTADATLYVDGILASSMVDANKLLGPSTSDKNDLNFGVVKIHIHTFMSRVIAPLFHSLCTKIDSNHCERKVDDGSGGDMNILMGTGLFLLNMSPLIQGLFLFLLPAAGAITLFGYYAIMGLAPITCVLGVVMALAKKQSQAKSKLA